MILDRENHVAAALAVAGTGNLLATDVIDLGSARDLGAGSDVMFYNSINTAAAAGGTSIEFQIIGADDAAMSVNVVVLATTGAVAIADIPINYLNFLRLQRAVPKRYISARLVRVGTFTGATTWSSGVTYDETDYRRFYAANFTA